MYNNNGYLGGVAPAGFSYQGNPNPPKYTQTLTKEEIQSLRQNVDQFSLGLTREEALRGICFHRDENGNDTLRPNPDGTVTCTICGYTFDPVQDMGEEEAQAAVNGLVDILQTIKLLYLDMPTEPAKEFFQVIPLLEKVPKLLKIASDNFSKHEQWNNYRFNGAPNTLNLYNMLANGFNTTPYQAQPQMGQPMGGMMGQQQPMMGSQPMMGANPFGNFGAPQQQMGQPMGGYQPQTNGFAYNPNMMQQPVQNVAPVVDPAQTAGAVQPTTTTAATDGKTVVVDQNFKA